METWTTIAPFVGLGGLLCSLLIYFYIKKAPAGNPEMVEIAEAIHEGAMTFLKREYTILAGSSSLSSFCSLFLLAPIRPMPFWPGLHARSSPVIPA